MAFEPSDRCPICKHLVGKDDLVCPSCGYSLLIVCVGCGTPTQMQYSYCPFCGRPLKTDEILPTYWELQSINEKNRTQLMEYASDLTRLYMSQRRIEQYVPTGLLDKVLLSDSQVVGERRYLTVLFSDVVGFTGLSSNLDPEEVFLLMNSCFRLLVEQVYKYGGSVDKFIGDALMALFGAPISYENDTERAVRAAIGMQKAMAEFNEQMLPKLGKPLELRIGITSGDAIAGTVGVEGQWSYTVMGSTVNMASRLQSATKPGTILVNEDVYQHTRDMFDYVVLSPIPLKGIGDAVPVFEVVDELTDASKFQPMPTTQASHFVGRDQELEQLHQIIQNLNGAGGGVVFITGDAGLGKTRLMREWQRQFPDEIKVWTGSAQNLAQTSYQAWQKVILQGLKLHQTSNQTVGSVLLDYLGDETWIPFLEFLLFGESVQRESLSLLEPEQLKEQIFIAVARFLGKVAERGPLVIILDDLQWIDQLSRELLQSVFNLSVSWPIVFCLGARPEAKELAALISGAKELPGDRSLEISLTPLSRHESQKLLDQKLSVANMPEKLHNYILERAQNNPYFLEELVSFILNSGLVEEREGQLQITDLDALTRLSLPGTLRGLIRAQLDRLSGAQQQIISYGAVIGPIFSASLLLDVVSQIPRLTNVSVHLNDLTKRGVLDFDGANYHFTHNSVHEVIYQSLLSERRRQMHQQVGEVLEVQAGTAVSIDVVEQLAYHFAAAENSQKAVPYLIEAGEKAKQRFANEAAIDYFSRAMKMLPEAPEFSSRRGDIYKAMGDLYQHRGDYDQALENYQEAFNLALDANQRTDRCRLMGKVWQWKGDVTEARRWFEEALREISKGHQEMEDATRGRVYVDMGLFCIRQGDFVHAERWGLDAVNVLEQAEELGDLARSLNALGGAYYFQNRWHEASERVERAYQIQLQIGDWLGVAGSLSNLGMLYAVECRWEEALQVFKQSIATCGEVGALETTLSNAHNNIAYVYTHQGRLDLAEEQLQRSLDLKYRTGTTLEVPESLNNLVLVSLFRGDYSTAEKYVAESIGLARQNDDQAALSEANRYLAQIKLAHGDLEAALEACQEAIILANRVGTKLSEGVALRTLAQIHLKRGEYKQARQAIQTSLRLLKGINHRYEVARTQIVIAEIALVEGDDPTYESAVKAARSVFEDLGARPALDLLARVEAQSQKA